MPFRCATLSPACRQRKYGDAARVRRVAEDVERRERAAFDADRLASFGLREKAAVAGQDAERAAVAKRIGLRREEHASRAADDARRLAQRNANACAMLASRQAAEAAKAGVAARLALATTRAQRAYGLRAGGGAGGNAAVPAARGLLAAAPFRAAAGRALLADGRVDTSVVAAAAGASTTTVAATGGAPRRASFTELVAAEVCATSASSAGCSPGAAYAKPSPAPAAAAAAVTPLRLHGPTEPVVAGRHVPAAVLVRAHLGAGLGKR